VLDDDDPMAIGSVMTDLCDYPRNDSDALALDKRLVSLAGRVTAKTCREGIAKVTEALARELGNNSAAGVDLYLQGFLA